MARVTCFLAFLRLTCLTTFVTAVIPMFCPVTCFPALPQKWLLFIYCCLRMGWCRNNFKNIRCVARHGKDFGKKEIKKLTLAKNICCRFRPLLLSSSVQQRYECKYLMASCLPAKQDFLFLISKIFRNNFGQVQLLTPFMSGPLGNLLYKIL